MKMYIAPERHKELSELVTLAENHAQAHEYERALALYGQALDLLVSVPEPEPTSDQEAALLNARATIRVQLGLWPQAQEDIRKVLASDVRDRGQRVRARVLRARIRSYRGEYAEAVQELQQVVEQEAADEACGGVERALAHIGLGTLSARVGEHQSGQESLRKARTLLEADKAERESALLLADAYLQQGLAAFREQQLEAARKLYNESLTLSREHATVSTVEADARRYIGVLHSIQGEPLVALREHLEALEIYKRTKNPLGQAKTFNSIGQTCLELSRLDEALYYMRRAQQICRHIGAEAEIATIYGKLGAIYTQREEFDRAVEFQLKDVELSRRFGNVRALAFATRNLGLSYQARGEFDEAMHYLKESLHGFEELDAPVNVAGVRLDLARSWLDRGDTVNAEGEVEQAMAILRDRPAGPDLALAHILGATIHRLNHGFEQARQQFDEALRILGDTPSIHLAEAQLGLGQLCYEMRNHDRAVAYLKQAVRISRELGQRRLIDRAVPLLERIDDTELVRLLIEDVENTRPNP